VTGGRLGVLRNYPGTDETFARQRPPWMPALTITATNWHGWDIELRPMTEADERALDRAGVVA